MDVIVDMTLPHDYQARLLDEIPGWCAENIIRFPGTPTGCDGLIVEVIPTKGNRWVGMFAFGTFSKSGLRGIYACPGGRTLCVVSSGEGYLVCADNPNQWEGIPVVGIADVRSLPDSDLIVFANYFEILALEDGNIKWRSSVVDDDLKITSVEGEVIRGTGWTVLQAYVQFSVDVYNGQCFLSAK